MEEAEYCHRLALMYRGSIIALGAPADLRDQMRSDALPEPTMEDVFVSLIEREEALAK